MKRHAWRFDGRYVSTLATYIGQHGGDHEHPPQAWLDAEQVPAPEDPNFIQIAPLVAYGDRAVGYQKTCPRDGQACCSMVDGLQDEGHSGKATQFMS